MLFPHIFPGQSLHSALSSNVTSSGRPSMVPAQSLTVPSAGSHSPPRTQHCILCSCIWLVLVSFTTLWAQQKQWLHSWGSSCIFPPRTVPGTKSSFGEHLLTKTRCFIDCLGSYVPMLPSFPFLHQGQAQGHPDLWRAPFTQQQCTDLLRALWSSFPPYSFIQIYSYWPH